MYKAVGYLGQSIVVVPESDLVVVFSGGLRDGDSDVILDLLLHQFIIPAADSAGPLKANPDGVGLLESQIQALADPKPQPAPSLPAMAQEISGRTYRLEDSAFGWRSFALTFQGDQEQVELHLGEGPLELPTGLNEVHRVTPID